MAVMTRRFGSLPTRYFDDLYASDPDPWCFASSAYERRKYEATLDALPRAYYAHGFEAGCSIGVLTRLLAPRCAQLTAVDASEAPLGAARQRSADQPHVHFARMRIPDEWPEVRFDLVLLSEVLYFMDSHDVAAIAKRIESSLDVAGHVILVHCIGTVVYHFSGDEATALFIDRARRFARVLRQDRTSRYRLDVLERG
jgi:SAM-dependent methyltransferase